MIGQFLKDHLLQNFNMQIGMSKIFIIFINISLCIASISGCKEQIEEVASSTERLNYTLVNTKKVELSNEAIPLFSIGTVASDRDIKLAFKIGGVIMDVYADEGKYVKKGDLLAVLRTTEIDAQVFKAKRALTKAERDLKRIQFMYQDSVATLENVDDLTTLVEVSRSDVDIAEFNQKYARISAPESGRLIQRLAEPGELTSPGRPIFILSSNKGKAIVKATFSDKDISRIHYGNKAEIEFDAFPNEIIEGKITQISESADPMTGTFQVDIAVNPGTKRMRNGYVGRVSVFPKQLKSYYKIPIDAIVEGESDYLKIFTPNESDTVAHLISVKPFKITSNYVAVYREGLPDLSRVITKGAPYLKDLDKIKIKAN